MSILLIHLALAGILLWRTRFWRIIGSRSWMILLLLLIRFACGIWFTEEYARRYGGGDMHGYLHDARLIAEIATEKPADFIRLIGGFEPESDAVVEKLNDSKIWIDRGYNPWFNDGRNLIRIHALIALASAGNPIVHLVWVNLLALFGFVFLLRAFFPERVPLWTLGFMIMPNALVWTSMLLKEHLLLLGMGMVLYSCVRLTTDGKRLFGIFGVGSLLMICIKSYWFLMLLPGLTIWVFSNGKLIGGQRVVWAYLVSALLLMLLSAVHVIPNIPDILAGQQRNAWRLAVYSGAGSVLSPIVFSNDWLSIIRHTPEAIAMALIQPLPKSMGDFAFFFFFENLLLPALIIALVLTRPRRQFLFTPLHSMSIISGFSMIAVSALTMPVAGTLIRFRLPGLLLILLSLAATYHQSSSRSLAPLHS